MVKAWSHAGVLAGLWLTLASPAFAQTSPAVENPDTNAAPADPTTGPAALDRPESKSESPTGDTTTSRVLEHSRSAAGPDAPHVLHYRVDHSEPQGDDTARRRTDSDAAASTAEAGFLSPYALSPQVVARRSWVRTVAGYDTAPRAFRARSSAESGVTGYLALRVDFEHGPSTASTDRVSLGTRLQVLRQEAHGLDVGLGLFYQPNDFRLEGNVVGGLMLGRTFGRVRVLGNALVGSDPEGDDQELEGRLGTVLRVNRLLELGWDGRFRSVVTNDAKRVGTTTIDWELAVLPNAIVTVGPLALIGEAGFSALQETEMVGRPEQRRSVRAGFLAMAGAGAAF